MTAKSQLVQEVIDELLENLKLHSSIINDEVLASLSALSEKGKLADSSAVHTALQNPAGIPK
ncbi:MAG: hypothetical protein WA621_06150 [Candidatus Acidiferrum sp.]